jgi:GTP-binding protein HflX
MDRIILFIPSKYKAFLDEELSLVRTLYTNVADTLFVRRPNPKYYIPLDKLDLAKDDSIDKIVIMDRVKPSQIINLVRETGKEVVDRILLILEIFSMHAGSLEAKMQIELAQLKHRLPLIKEAIKYAKIGELHGFLGAGRYGYEKYYTMLRSREARIRRKLEKLRETRMIRRMRRIRLGYPHISIIGYTCAGKTTLFNRLTASNKDVGPEPFTTLSPKSSRIMVNGIDAIVTDTVGFIRDLPHEIIEAFYATLEEINYSDIIVNVVDSSKSINRIMKDLYESRRILSEIGVHGKPVIIALNKIDLVEPGELRGKMKLLKNEIMDNEIIIPISAVKGVNIDLLLSVLKQVLEAKEIAEDLRAKIWSQTGA